MDQDPHVRELEALQAKILRAEWPGTVTRDEPFIMRWQEAGDLVTHRPFSTELPSGITPHVNLASTDPMVPTYNADDAFRCGEIMAVDPHTRLAGPITRMTVSFAPAADVAMWLKERNGDSPNCDVVCVIVVHALYIAGNPFSRTVMEFNRAYFIFNGKTGHALDRCPANVPRDSWGTDSTKQQNSGGSPSSGMFQIGRGGVNLIIDQAVGKLQRRDEKPPYLTLLPDELGMWYYYTTDYGHSILCVIPQSMPFPDPSKIIVSDVAPYLAFVPVKQVLRTGYRVDNRGGGFVWCDVPYTQELGVISEPDDVEY